MKKKIRWSKLMKLLILIVILSACHTNIPNIASNAQNTDQKQQQSATATSRAQQTSPQSPGEKRTKKSGCQAQGSLQDKRCTPGDIFAKTSVSYNLQSPAMPQASATLSVSTKNKVYTSYGIVKRENQAQYQIDHLRQPRHRRLK